MNDFRERLVKSIHVEPLKQSVILAVGIVCAGFLTRMLILMVSWDKPIETFEYEAIAHNLLSGRGYGIEHFGVWKRTFGSPPFSYLCAFVYLVSGDSHHAMVVVQAILSSIAALSCYSIGCRLFSAKVGLVAAGLVAFHPALAYIDTHKVHPLSFDVALAALGIEMALMLKTRLSWKATWLTGLLHGLAVLERSTFIGMVPVALFSIGQRREGESLLRVSAVYLLAVLVIPTPWVLRNLQIYQEPVLVSTTGAEVFWRGNNAIASGGSYAAGRPGISVFEAMPEEFRKLVLGKDELTQSHIFTQAALSFVTSHPMEAIRLYGRKLLSFWWFSPHEGFLYPESYLAIYKLYYVIALSLGLIGIATAFREKRRPERLSVIAFLILASLLQAVFYVEGRHRWGIEPLLLVFTAAGGQLLMGAVFRTRPA